MLLNYSLRYLFYYRQRSFLSIIGICIAAIAFLLLSHLPNMLIEKSLKQMTLNGNLSMLAMWHNHPKLSPDDIKAIIEPTHQNTLIGHTVIKHPKQSFSIFACDDLSIITQYRLLDGRDLHPNDHDHYTLITESFQKKLQDMAISAEVGDYIHSDTLSLRIVGVISDILLPPIVLQGEPAFIVHTKTLTHPPSTLLIVLPSLKQALTEAEAISSQLIAHYPHEIRTLSPKHFIHATGQIVDIISQLGQLVLVISTLLGAMNMLSNALADLQKRRQLFALHIALGATFKQMTQMVIVENCLICLLASITSFLLTPLILWGLSLYYDLPFILEPLSFILTLGFSLLLGVLISLYPAHVLTKTPLALLLKEE